jgi:major membrane immunogen (membrane-anchored lipoprotein)
MNKIGTDFSKFTHRTITFAEYTLNLQNLEEKAFDKRLHIQTSHAKLLKRSWSYQSVNSYLLKSKETLDHSILNTTLGIPALEPKKILQKWFNSNQVIVKQTDKNLGIAIISTKDYHEKVLELLNDTTIYLKIRNFDMDEINMNYFNLIKEIYNDITDKQSQALLKASLDFKISLPIFHIIPKIHKNPWTGRPIVSSLKWITRSIALIINKELEAYAETIPTLIRDSKELIQLLDKKTVTEDCNFFFFRRSFNVYKLTFEENFG